MKGADVFHKIKFWFAWPGLFIYFRGSERSRVLVTCGDEVLLVHGLWWKWFRDPRWGLPGGGIVPGEDAAKAAARELKEEISLEINPDEFIFLGESRISEAGIGYQGHFFVLPLAKKVEPKPDGYEIIDVRWHPLDSKLKAIVKPEVTTALELSDKQ